MPRAMKVVILDVVGIKFTPSQLDAISDLISFVNDLLKEKAQLVTITSKRKIAGPRWKWYLKDLSASEEAAILKTINKKIADVVAEHFDGKMGKIRVTIREATENDRRETQNGGEDVLAEAIASPS